MVPPSGLVRSIDTKERDTNSSKDANPSKDACKSFLSQCQLVLGQDERDETDRKRQVHMRDTKLLFTVASTVVSLLLLTPFFDSCLYDTFLIRHKGVNHTMNALPADVLLDATSYTPNQAARAIGK